MNILPTKKLEKTANKYKMQFSHDWFQLEINGKEETLKFLFDELKHPEENKIEKYAILNFLTQISQLKPTAPYHQSEQYKRESNAIIEKRKY